MKISISCKSKNSLIIFLVILFITSCSSNSTEPDNGQVKTVQETNENRFLNDASSLEKAVEEDSLNVEKIFNLAHSYYSSKELDKALVQFMKVYKIDNKNLHALINIGNINYDLDKKVEAVDFYNKALEIDPDNLNVRCDMATCIGMSGDLDKAIALLKENITLNNSHAQSHHNLSVFLEKKGDNEGALKEMSIYNSLIQ